MMKTPVEDSPLLHNFVNGDDAYRNSRFKLIPYISKVGTCSIFSVEIENLSVLLHGRKLVDLTRN